MTFNIENMLKPEVYDHSVKNITLIETHISWVILTGDFAYKIKKPVNFGFLDFSTLEKRKQFCDQEITLNSRLAADIYLEVVAIAGTADNPRISASNTAFEFAVKMAQFPQSAQLDNMLAAGDLKLEHMDAVGHMIANFHQSTNICDKNMTFGDKDAVYQPVDENFKQIKENLKSTDYADRLTMLSQWSKSESTRMQSVFSGRKTDGFIRQCHGDMHLRNLVWLNNKPMAFDCIEFNSKLSWIDVISEIAFLVMDLQDRKQQKLANRFLNTYLEHTGDYGGLIVLPFYLCYRALVRAKVNALRLNQNDLRNDERNKTITAFESYLELAVTYTQVQEPKIIIMRGLSASGKSTVSQKLLDDIGAIRIRSDVERKRLFETTSTNDAPVEVDKNINTGIYSKNASQQTYTKLIELTSITIQAGYSVVVDAAFLKHEQRELFRQLAQRLEVPFVILEITAPAELLRQRIAQRKNDVSDADLAVLEHQLSNWQPLHEEEFSTAVRVDTSEQLDTALLIEKLNEYNSNDTKT
ncbi:MAG: AAA family ATPase [Proteobacteria bacterium]|nr:AAA family ATPase [Pseudomonadota bacterium]